MPYKNKVVVVTGAANGIGRALAHAYALKGATTILIDKNEIDLVETCHKIEKKGGIAVPFVLDLSNAISIESTFSDIKKSQILY